MFVGFSAGLQSALSHLFYFDWIHEINAIDGGPLGFLAWAMPMLAGTFACDLVAQEPVRRFMPKLLGYSALLMLAGYLMSCGTTLYDVRGAEVESIRNGSRTADPVIPSRDRLATHTLRWAEPPFVPPSDDLHRVKNYWMMSQRAATLSYHLFATGFSFLVYGAFYLFAELWGWQVALFRTLGTNALFAYVAHELVDNTVKPYVPFDAPGSVVFAGFLVFFTVTWLFVRHLEKRGVYLTI